MKKVLVIFAVLIGIFVAFGGTYAYYLYNSAKSAANQMHEKVKTDNPKPVIQGKDLKPISIMLLGVDERPDDKGRSDTIVILAINPKTDSMLMFSIPRDTRTEIIGKGYKSKINHAYAYGGTQMAMDTVENFLDTSLDYYIKVNMDSFKEIVNAVGGVEVHNTKEFSYQGYQFPKGTIEMYGDEALAYSRMRKQDIKGDLGRNDRQQQIIKSVIDKGSRVSSITKFDSILDILGENVKTNMTFSEMKDIQQNYKNARNQINTTEIEGKSDTINGGSYFIVNEDERTRLKKLLDEYLSD